MTTGPTRVVFIHGLWLHATSWAPWVELFRDVGRRGAGASRVLVFR